MVGLALVLSAPPASAAVGGEVLFKGQDLLQVPERELRAVRGGDISMIFQEPMTSLNPLHTVERQVSETLTVHRGLGQRAARARASRFGPAPTSTRTPLSFRPATDRTIASVTSGTTWSPSKSVTDCAVRRTRSS